MSWSFRCDGIQLNFLEQTAASRCEVCQNFTGTNCFLISSVLVVWFSKPPAHPEDGEGVSPETSLSGRKNLIEIHNDAVKMGEGTPCSTNLLSFCAQ